MGIHTPQPATDVLVSIGDLQKLLMSTFGGTYIETTQNTPLFHHRHHLFGKGILIAGEGVPNITQKKQCDATEDRISIFLVEQGRVHVRHMGQSYDLQEGQLAIFDQCRGLTLEHMTAYRIKSLLIPKPDLSLFNIHGIEQMNRPITTEYGPARIIKSLVCDLETIGEDITAADRSAHWASVCRFLSYALQDLIEKQEEEFEENHIINKTRTCINQNYADADLNQHDIAHSAGVSLRTLHRSLAQQGNSLANLLLQTRIEHARRLLQASHYKAVSIATIAHEVGFKDPAHFSRVFKQRVGITPGAWRQMTRICV